MLEDTMTEMSRVDCPYCGESFETAVDATAGSQSYIEDCPVCCRPVELSVSVGSDGAFQGLQVHRDDD